MADQDKPDDPDSGQTSNSTSGGPGRPPPTLKIDTKAERRGRKHSLRKLRRRLRKAPGEYRPGHPGNASSEVAQAERRALPAVPDKPSRSLLYDPRYVDVAPVPTGAMTYTVNDDGIALVQALARECRDIETIAATLGICKTTFREIRKRQPEVQQALDRGRAGLGDEISDLLLLQARQGNTTAAIFLSKARLHWRDQGPIPGEAAAPNISITINAPMDANEWEQMINVTPEMPDDEGGA
ncbi:MAG: hypothetical protein ACK5JT_20200 [Hyphomicrobiaceae bacterium]